MFILLTGSEGQVGRKIMDLALKKQFSLIGCNKEQLDITQLNQIQRYFQQYPDINIVINAAAYTAVDQAEDEITKAYAVNQNGVKNLALACQEKNIPLLHISTDYVFSGDSNKAYRETDEPGPLSVYGRSKLEGEEILRSIWNKHVILRVSWVFGRYGHNFVKTILKLAKEREELNIVSDQFGCPTSATSIAKVLITIAERIHAGDFRWGVYHYCNKPVTTWYDFAKNIVQLAQKEYLLSVKKINPISAAQYPTKAKRPTSSILSTDKIIQDYGITQSDWRKELEELLKSDIL